MRSQIQLLIALRIVLVEDFPETELDDLSQLALEEPLTTFAGTGLPKPEVVKALVEGAKRLHRVAQLIEAAKERRPLSETLKAIGAEYAPVAALDELDHFESVQLLGGLVLVDRKPLRQRTREIERNPLVERLILIEGDPVSGKSYSTRFFGYLAEVRKSFRFAEIDLESLGAAQARAVTAHDVGHSIARQLKLTGMPERGREQESRWILMYCDWLTGVHTADESPCWVAIDGFDKALMGQGVHDLIQELVKRLYNTLRGLRLFLIGYPNREALTRLVSGALVEERIQNIGEQELTETIVSLYVLRQQKLGLEFDENALKPLQASIADSVVRVLAQCRDGDPRRLETLGIAARTEALSILAGAAGETNR